MRRPSRTALARALPALLTGLLLANCRSVAEPDLRAIYERAAQTHSLDRNPVIVIPGLLGSRLRDESGVRVWGAFSGKFADPESRGGAQLFGLPMQEGVPLRELRDGVRPDGTLDSLKVRVFGLPITVDAYRYVLGVLGVGGYTDPELANVLSSIDYGEDHFTCFQFAFDWRRDVAKNAALLADFIEEKEAYVRERQLELTGEDPGEIRFDLVAHSMGALVARYFLRYGDQPLAEDLPRPELDWRGAPAVENVVLVAPPNAGSMDALIELVNGTQLAPFTPKYEAALVGTFPATYQLLPRGRHGVLEREGEPVEALLAPELWEKERWGLADPEQAKMLEWLLPDVDDPEERRRIALDHQRKCLRQAELLFDCLDRPAERPEELGLFLFAGDATDTPSAARFSGNRPEICEWAPGDGTVLRSSALLDERLATGWQPRLKTPIDWSSVHFMFRDHLGMTQDPGFTDNVLYILLERP